MLAQGGSIKGGRNLSTREAVIDKKSRLVLSEVGGRMSLARGIWRMELVVQKIDRATREALRDRSMCWKIEVYASKRTRYVKKNQNLYQKLLLDVYMCSWKEEILKLSLFCFRICLTWIARRHKIFATGFVCKRRYKWRWLHTSRRMERFTRCSQSLYLLFFRNLTHYRSIKC